MAFSQSTLRRTDESRGLRAGITWYIYTTDVDDLTAIQAEGYEQNPRYDFSEGDLIWVSCVGTPASLLRVKEDLISAELIGTGPGSISAQGNIVYVSSSTQMSTTPTTYWVDTQAGDVVMTLPAPDLGRWFVVKKGNSGGGSVIIGGAEPIDGDMTVVLQGDQRPAVTIVAANTVWGIV